VINSEQKEMMRNSVRRRDWQPERTDSTTATALCATFPVSKLWPQLTRNPRIHVGRASYRIGIYDLRSIYRINTRLSRLLLILLCGQEIFCHQSHSAFTSHRVGSRCHKLLRRILKWRTFSWSPNVKNVSTRRCINFASAIRWRRSTITYL